MRLILFFVGASVILPAIIESATYNLNKVICRSFDKSFCEFQTCEMKMIRRGAAVFNMNLTLHKKPIDRIILNLQLFKKSNGYRPFLINQTIDFCYYMRNPTAYMFFQSFHKTFFSASNLNHTCPYKHDIYIKDLVYDKHTMIDLPLPNGEYMVHIKSSTLAVLRTEFKIYVTRFD